MAWPAALLSVWNQRRQSAVSTFVTVGSSPRPFYRLLRAVETIIDELPKPVRMQTGSASTISATGGIECVAFIPGATFDQYLEEARVVICHGGATLVQAVAQGHMPLVSPRRKAHEEAIDDHQVAFVEALTAAGHCLRFDDAATLRAALRQMLPRRRRDGAITTALLTSIRNDLATWDRPS